MLCGPTNRMTVEPAFRALMSTTLISRPKSRIWTGGWPRSSARASTRAAPSSPVRRYAWGGDTACGPRPGHAHSPGAETRLGDDGADVSTGRGPATSGQRLGARQPGHLEQLVRAPGRRRREWALPASRVALALGGCPLVIPRSEPDSHILPGVRLKKLRQKHPWEPPLGRAGADGERLSAFCAPVHLFQVVTLPLRRRR